ncbi:hypothetical protein BDQ17DRAFT_1435135 [Cyathus striatus]|nr:hypothetical protein BDQ17DRAFT_1435135 [Cyathus striatus]
MAFNNAHDFSINQAHFNEINTNFMKTGMSGLQYLYQYVARGASHNSKDQYEAPKCDPRTREQLLDNIHEWMKVEDKETGIWYLHGPAGSGKSCIARSVCKRATSEGILGASFFFWRNAADRNNPNKIFTTLAYQLATANEELEKFILQEVEKTPHIGDLPLDDQFRRLILEPCRKVPQEQLLIKAIVIDGLDECIDEMMQLGILRLLAKAVRDDKFPLGIFITSRPERNLCEALDTKEIIFATQVVSLDRIPGVTQDIRTVLESGFARILNNPGFKKSLRSVPRPWPPPDAIEKLVQRSSRQFIYSATVLKFVSSPDDNPASQLEIVLGIRDSNDSSPFADLDLLYNEIMSRVKHCKKTMRVLGYILAINDLNRRIRIFVDRSISRYIRNAVLHNQNRLLLVAEHLMEFQPEEAYQALNQLHSLISLSVGSGSFKRHLEIDFHHRSFVDYLTTRSRSNMHFVDVKTAHFDIGFSCLKFMSRETYETDEHSVVYLYSSFLWDEHIYRSGRYINLNAFDFALRRFFHHQPSLGYLNALRVTGALRILGLLDLKLDASLPIALKNLESHSMLTPGNLYNIVDKEWDKLYENRSVDLEYFRSSILFPVWVNYLKTYEDELSTKQLIISCYIVRGNIGFYSSILMRKLKTANLIADDSESMFERLDDIERRFSNHGELKRFLSARKYSGPFHCTFDDYTLLCDITSSAYMEATERAMEAEERRERYRLGIY